MTATPAPMPDPVEHRKAVEKIKKDLRKTVTTLSRDEARFLVGNYYTMQDARIRAAAQVRELAEDKKEHDALAWVGDQSSTLEGEVSKMLDTYSAAFALGQWARSICGVGPVICAGLLAHIDFNPWSCSVHKANPNEIACSEFGEDKKTPHPGCGRSPLMTCGQIWRFAGLDPSSVWEKGELRPWSADLKVLCWKLGHSFVMVSSNENDVYGHFMMERKELLTAENNAGKFAATAAEILVKRPTHKQKAILATGKLTPGHIAARAQRVAVKLFLSHFFHVGYELKHGTPPPKPFILTQPGHTHFISPPNWPSIMQEEGMDTLKKLPE